MPQANNAERAIGVEWRTDAQSDLDSKGKSEPMPEVRWMIEEPIDGCMPLRHNHATEEGFGRLVDREWTGVDKKTSFSLRIHHLVALM